MAPGGNRQESKSHVSISSGSSVADELSKLAKLKTDGILTEQEFETIKKSMLEGVRTSGRATTTSVYKAKRDAPKFSADSIEEWAFNDDVKDKFKELIQ